MTPPERVTRGRAARPIPRTPTQEIEELLSTTRLFRDASQRRDPQHFARQWEDDQAFRTSRENQPLFFALDAIHRYFEGEELSPADRRQITSWRESAESSEEGSIDRVVFTNLRSVLPLFHSATLRSRAQTLQAMLSHSASEGRASQDGFHIQSVTLGAHFADEFLRPLPSYYTLGILPREGLGQNASSTAAGDIGVQWSLGDFDFFTDVYGGDAAPLGAPAAHFGQLGLRFGIAEYNRGLGFRSFNGFRFALLGGLSRMGFGLGLGWCDSIDGSEISGAQCGDASNQFQVSAFSDSPLLSVGFGPLELSLGTWFNNSWAAINSSGPGLPETDREPLTFRLVYQLEDPSGPPADSTLETLFPRQVSDAQVMRTGFTLVNNAFLNNYRRRQESAYELSRILIVSDVFGPSSSSSRLSLLNLGSFFNGVLNGVAEGTLAYRLSQDLRLGNSEQRTALGILMGAELLMNTLGSIFSPGEPSAEEFAGGETDGITNLQAQAFRMSWPGNLVQDTLAVLGAVGAFGDREAAIRSDSPFGPFQIAHGAMAVAGVILILTSGDFSGEGFFGNSLLGNQLPNGEIGEITHSQYSLASQRFQAFRLEAGAALLSYAVYGLGSYFFGRLSYLEYQDRQHRPSEHASPVSVGVATDGRSGVMGTVGARY